LAALHDRLLAGPDAPHEPFVLDGHTLKEYRSRHEHLIQVASAEIDWLYDHIAMSGCALMLTDAGGIVLYEKADPTILETFRMAGCRWERIGANCARAPTAWGPASPRIDRSSCIAMNTSARSYRFVLHRRADSRS
jgi:hypothetical protein